MPYIEEYKRAEMESTLSPPDEGCLNFAVTQLVDEYIKRHGLCYATLNEAIGVLECAKLELYRRVVAPYEDTKIEQNGDVYTVGIAE